MAGWGLTRKFAEKPEEPDPESPDYHLRHGWVDPLEGGPRWLHEVSLGNIHKQRHYVILKQLKWGHS